MDISSVEDRLLAIYELAAMKKKQKSVDKIQAALQDLFDCLKGVYQVREGNVLERLRKR